MILSSKPVKSLIGLLILVLAAGAMQAQVPGFMGRRNAVRADLYIMPGGPGRYDSPPTPSGKEGFFFNHTDAVSYERIASRRSTMSLGVDLTRFGYSFFYLPTQQFGRRHCNVWGLGLQYKAFPFLRKGWIAPLGPYFSLDIRALFVRDAFVPEGIGTRRALDSGNAISGGFGFGNSMAITERFLLDLGVRCLLSDVPNYVLRASKYSRDELYLADLLKFRIGLSFLL